MVFDPSDVVTLIKGRHVLHFGGEFLINRADSTAWGNIRRRSIDFGGNLHLARRRQHHFVRRSILRRLPARPDAVMERQQHTGVRWKMEDPADVRPGRLEDEAEPDDQSGCAL